MHLPRFSVLALCLFVALGSGCRKSGTSASDPTIDQGDPKHAAPAGAAAAKTGSDKGKPKDELDVPGLLKNGGKNWSSHEGYSAAGDEIKAGEGFWIWPAEDKVWTAAGEDLIITLRWKRRPDKVEAGKENPVGAEIAGVGPGMSFRSYAPLNGFDAAADQGAAEANFRFRHKGEGEVAVYLVAGGKKAASNILRLKAKSAP